MKSPQVEAALEGVSLAMIGRSHSVARATQTCVSCGGPATEFKDEVSRKEYSLSVLCQKCQDRIYGAEEGYVNQD
jgi:hypothetical protein